MVRGSFPPTRGLRRVETGAETQTQMQQSLESQQPLLAHILGQAEEAPPSRARQELAFSPDSPLLGPPSATCHYDIGHMWKWSLTFPYQQERWHSSMVQPSGICHKASDPRREGKFSATLIFLHPFLPIWWLKQREFSLAIAQKISKGPKYSSHSSKDLGMLTPTAVTGHPLSYKTGQSKWCVKEEGSCIAKPCRK